MKDMVLDVLTIEKYRNRKELMGLITATTLFDATNSVQDVLKTIRQITDDDNVYTALYATIRTLSNEEIEKLQHCLFVNIRNMNGFYDFIKKETGIC